VCGVEPLLQQRLARRGEKSVEHVAKRIDPALPSMAFTEVVADNQPLAGAGVSLLVIERLSQHAF